MLCIGIDPGIHGFSAVISYDENDKISAYTHFAHKNGGNVDGRLIQSIMDYKKTVDKSIICIIEHLHGMPGDGASNAFKLGYSAGMCHATMETINFIYDLKMNILFVSPQKWQTGMHRFISRTEIPNAKHRTQIIVQKMLGNKFSREISDCYALALYGHAIQKGKENEPKV